MITALLSLGISLSASLLGSAPVGRFIQKLIKLLSPSVTPLGAWIGQFVLGFGLGELPSLIGYLKKR